jgi:hypothetical protein
LTLFHLTMSYSYLARMTVDGRTALYTAAHRQAEDTRQQIRKHHQAAAKKGKWEKHSVEVTEVCLSTLILCVLYQSNRLRFITTPLLVSKTD